MRRSRFLAGSSVDLPRGQYIAVDIERHRRRAGRRTRLPAYRCGKLAWRVLALVPLRCRRRIRWRRSLRRRSGLPLIVAARSPCTGDGEYACRADEPAKERARHAAVPRRALADPTLRERRTWKRGKSRYAQVTGCNRFRSPAMVTGDDSNRGRPDRARRSRGSGPCLARGSAT